MIIKFFTQIFSQYFLIEAREYEFNCFYLTQAKTSEDALFDTVHEILKRKYINISRDEIAQNFDMYVEASWQYEDLRRFKTAMDNFNLPHNINPRMPQASDYDLTLINNDNYLEAFDLPVSILPTGPFDERHFLIQTSTNFEDDVVICVPFKISGPKLKQLSKTRNIRKIG